MSTTAIFAEILIIGIQSAIWMALLVSSLVGWDWMVDLLTQLKDWAALATVLLLALFYTGRNDRFGGAFST
jgi:hypothetical protein